MSQAYRPSQNATAGDPWHIAFLSERDVSSQVPINFVPHAGVFLTASCFGQGAYEDDAAQLCLSNLIASQMRRFVIDIYWDPDRRSFGLCPFRIPTTASSVRTLENNDAATARLGISGNTTSIQDLRPRQTLGSFSNIPVVASNATVDATTTTTASTPVPSSTSSSGTVLYQVGPYRCSSSLDIDTVLEVFQDYYQQSANTRDARLQFLIFNLRSAQPYDVSTNSTTTTSLSGGQLPNGDDSFGGYFERIDQYVYKPSQLAEERRNLNGSWYRQSGVELQSLERYLSTYRLPDGYVASSDGWPSEGYVQNSQARRALLSYGVIDESMIQYNYRADSVLFPPGVLARDVVTQLSATGSVSSGCFYNASEYSLSQINSSWASTGVVTADLQDLYYAADNLTLCGISSFLNATLNGSSADTNPDPYQQFGNQALWSWAAGQPSNDSDSNRGAGSDNDQFRCATIVSNDDYAGHWRVDDCRQRYYVACREGNQPYRWRISQNAATFDRAADACDGNSTFDTPRTGLENLYLRQQILNEAQQRNTQDMTQSTWVNFNSLNTEGCWVTSGPDGDCPYTSDEATIRERQILVPAIGAFIVLLLTVLTLIVKCNANRRNSKIRRRGDGGWDYEGVPS